MNEQIPLHTVTATSSHIFLALRGPRLMRLEDESSVSPRWRLCLPPPPGALHVSGTRPGCLTGKCQRGRAASDCVELSPEGLRAGVTDRLPAEPSRVSSGSERFELHALDVCHFPEHTRLVVFYAAVLPLSQVTKHVSHLKKPKVIFVAAPKKRGRCEGDEKDFVEP